MAGLKKIDGVKIWTARSVTHGRRAVVPAGQPRRPQAVAALYQKDRIGCATRGGQDRPGLRFSPHFYNTMADVERTVGGDQEVHGRRASRKVRPSKKRGGWLSPAAPSSHYNSQPTTSNPLRSRIALQPRRGTCARRSAAERHRIVCLGRARAERVAPDEAGAIAEGVERARRIGAHRRVELNQLLVVQDVVDVELHPRPHRADDRDVVAEIGVQQPYAGNSSEPRAPKYSVESSAHRGSRRPAGSCAVSPSAAASPPGCRPPPESTRQRPETDRSPARPKPKL